MNKLLSASIIAGLLLFSTGTVSGGAAEPAKAEVPAVVSAAPAKAAEPAKAEVPAVVSAAPAEAADPAVEGEPKDLEGAVALISVAIDLAKTGKWLALAIILIQLLVFGIKRFAPKTFMKQWGSVTVAGLAAGMALLARVVGGASWVEAAIVFASGPGASLIIDTAHAFGILKRSEEAVEEKEKVASKEDA